MPLAEELEIEAFDGTRKLIRNWAVPIRDDHDEVTGPVVVKEQPLWIEQSDSVEDLLLASKDRYDRQWLIERHGHRTPTTVRATFATDVVGQLLPARCPGISKRCRSHDPIEIRHPCDTLFAGCRGEKRHAALRTDLCALQAFR
jgi:hypothetical protein